ncbi:hypothetical protein AVEN_192476-1 [Araneus ventricosus]|uniref:Histone-lysine N-methyltransferase SETMAR n=1 Tax=Araneus ventricosus TaxID=182803 RepID=A0A4Y2M4L0_ARAVE|nr:hypothetical protein AVEN_192476-1 [Araneus ventricosus]
MLSNGVLLLHDKARLHTVSVTRDLKQRFRWNVLEHPPYSPDLAQSDFHLFGPLKKHQAGRHFRTDAEVQEDVVNGSATWTLISSMPVPIDWFNDGANASTTMVTMW